MSEQDVIERRAIDVGMLIAKIETLHEDIISMDTKLTKHIEDEVEDIAKAVKDIFVQSMPNEDAALHKQMHETEMQILKDRKEFWKKLLFELSKTGIVGVLGWMGYSLWVAFLSGPTK
jgi:MoaA/NifB/PqqE/SkfB family radical SAM enzyme